MHGDSWYGNNDSMFFGGNGLSGWQYLIILGIIIIIVALIFLARSKNNNNGNQALNTLKDLYVKGGITEEEYLKRKNMIERQ
jgi:putative membrane protein